MVGPLLFRLYHQSSLVSLHHLSESNSISLTCRSAVGRLFAFLRSPVWITTGFGAKYAGPGGTNFNCEYRGLEHAQTLIIVDSKEQIAEFNADSEAYTQYARDVEGELNKRFTLVSSFRRRLSYILT